MSRPWPIACLALLAAGCTQPDDEVPPCTPAAHGLALTPAGQDWLPAAVADANALLAAEGRYRLRLMAEDVAPSAAEIPVWPVSSRGLTPMHTAFVLPECRAIYVQAAALSQRAQHWTGDTNTGLTIETAPIATWILLHEVGHLHDAAVGQFDPAPAVRGHQFSDTPQKRAELSADAYAARLIRMGDASANPPAAAFLAAMRIRIELTDLGWNLQRDRQLAHFGSSVLATPDAFGDVGDTHPNLELRVFITQVLLNDTDEARKLLDDFVALRQRAADPQPRILYDGAGD